MDVFALCSPLNLYPFTMSSCSCGHDRRAGSACSTVCALRVVMTRLLWFSRRRLRLTREDLFIKETSPRSPEAHGQMDKKDTNMTSASSASNTADIILEPLLSGTPEVRQAAKILCDGFTVPMGRVFPKGKVTDELIAWRVQLIEGVLEMQKRGCPGPVIVAKRRGSDEVLGVAAWVTLREGEEKNAETGEPQWYLPMPAIPAESGDVDPEIWKQWRGAFTDIQKRYGSDMGGTYTGAWCSHDPKECTLTADKIRSRPRCCTSTSRAEIPRRIRDCTALWRGVHATQALLRRRGPLQRQDTAHHRADATCCAVLQKAQLRSSRKGDGVARSAARGVLLHEKGCG